MSRQHFCFLFPDFERFFRYGPKKRSGLSLIYTSVGTYAWLVVYQFSFTQYVHTATLGTLVALYQVASLISILFISYLGGQRHIPTWVAAGNVLSGVGYVIYFLPHFLTQPYSDSLHFEEPNNRMSDREWLFVYIPGLIFLIK